MSDDRIALTAKEAGDLVGLSAEAMRRLARRDAVPHRHIGGAVRFPLRLLRLWVEQQTHIPIDMQIEMTVPSDITAFDAGNGGSNGTPRKTR